MNLRLTIPNVGRTKTTRRKLFDLHSWVGFQLAVFMTLVVATGTFAVVSNEIDWLIHPELRSSVGENKADWAQIESAIRSYEPNHVLAGLSKQEASYFTHKATMISPQGERYYLYVDPYTGAIAGRTGTLTVQRFLRDLHRYLFMPGIIGLPLVTTVSIMLLLSLFTGLKTVRNWKTVATRIRLAKGMRVAVGDFHKFAGLWSSWFFILIIATSFWYFAELMARVGGAAFEPSRPGITEERAASFGPTVQLADSATLVAAAEKAFPGFQATHVDFAVRAKLASSVLGRHNDLMVRSRANRIFLDPVDASVIHIQRSHELSWIAYLNELADPLHFGSFGGLTTKVIWFIFGLVMLSLTVTGVWLSWKRLRSRSPTIAQWASVPLLLVVVVFAVPYLQRQMDDGRFQISQSFTKSLDDTFHLTLTLQQDPKGAALGPFLLGLQSDFGRINLAEAELHLVCELCKQVKTLKPRVIGQSILLKDVFSKQQLTNANSVDIKLTFLSGESVDTKIKLE